MGWLFSESWETRADMVAHFRKPGWLTERYEMLKSSAVGNNFWYLAKHKESGEIFIGLNLMKGPIKGHPGWGYKDLTEDMGPCEKNCPITYLDRATPTEHQYAKPWREEVRKYHADKAKFEKAIAAGTVLEYGDNKYRLVRPYAPRKGWYADRVSDGQRFRLKATQISRSKLVEQPGASA